MVVNPRFRTASKSPKPGLRMVRVLDDQVQRILKHGNQKPMLRCRESRRRIRQPQVIASAQVPKCLTLYVRPLFNGT